MHFLLPKVAKGGGVVGGVARFSLRWLVVIKVEMSARKAEIHSETQISDGGKERKS